MAKARTTPIYVSPQDAALAFYQAFEARDLDAMMAAWADDEDIVCVHPGGARMVGYDAVRAGWEQLFSGDNKLSFRLDEVVVLETVGLGDAERD
jgi:ketosteroid isomerase-like protein